jgi:hypothetical protein
MSRQGLNALPLEQAPLRPSSRHGGNPNLSISTSGRAAPTMGRWVGTFWGFHGVEVHIKPQEGPSLVRSIGCGNLVPTARYRLRIPTGCPSAQTVRVCVCVCRAHVYVACVCCRRGGMGVRCVRARECSWSRCACTLGRPIFETIRSALTFAGSTSSLGAVRASMGVSSLSTHARCVCVYVCVCVCVCVLCVCVGL